MPFREIRNTSHYEAYFARKTHSVMNRNFAEITPSFMDAMLQYYFTTREDNHEKTFCVTVNAVCDLCRRRLRIGGLRKRY